MKIGLFFGSFNPIHIGHLIIANGFAQNAQLDQVWLVVTPQNPHKKKSNLLNKNDRLHLINLSIEDNDLLKVSTVEFNLPTPSYTIDTLTHLSEQHPSYKFTILMGGDNLQSLHKWKNYEQIIKHYNIAVYPRPGYENSNHLKHPNVSVLDLPLLNISATYIRNCLKSDKSIRYLVPDKVHDYIRDYNIYKT